MTSIEVVGYAYLLDHVLKCRHYCSCFQNNEETRLVAISNPLVTNTMCVVKIKVMIVTLNLMVNCHSVWKCSFNWLRVGAKL